MNPSIEDTLGNLTLDPKEINQRSPCCLINRPKDVKKSEEHNHNYKEHKGRKQMIDGVVKETYGDQNTLKSSDPDLWGCEKRAEAFW